METEKPLTEAQQRKLFLIALALEGGRLKDAQELARRLAWQKEDGCSVASVLARNDLRPTGVTVRVDELWERVAVGQGVVFEEEGVGVARQEREKWAVMDQELISGLTTQQMMGRMERHPVKGVAILLPACPALSNLRLYWRLDDALAARKPEQHVVAMHWAGEHSAPTSRYMCTTEEQLRRRLALAQRRPLCDRTLHTVALGGYAMRIVQLDVEAYLNLNPGLATQDAQNAYMARLLEWLRRFLQPEHLGRHLVLLGSDADRFSARLYAAVDHPWLSQGPYGHDSLVACFWDWLRRTEGAVEELRIFHRYGPEEASSFLAHTFALDPLASGRNRQMRGPGQSKAGKRTLCVPDGWTLDDAFLFALPNDLGRPVIRGAEELPQYEVKVDRILSDTDYGNVTEHVLRARVSRGCPEDSYLYQHKALYELLRKYPVRSPDECTLMWHQGSDRVQRFAVPLEVYEARFLPLLAHVLSEGASTLLFHEVCDTNKERPRHPSVDFDGVTHMTRQEAAREYEVFLQTVCGVAVPGVVCKESPPKNGGQYFHLVASQVGVAGHDANRAHRLEFREWLKQRHPENESLQPAIDLNPANLRMLGSDRLQAKSGDWSHRVTQWRGPDAVPWGERLRACSIHLLPTQQVVMVQPRVQLPARGSTRPAQGIPYDANNAQHRVLAAVVGRIMAAVGREARIHAVQWEEGVAWWVFMDSHYCPVLQLQKGRDEHQRRTLAFLVRERGGPVLGFCNDSDCKAYRTQHGLPTWQTPEPTPEERQILFPETCATDVRVIEEEVDAHHHPPGRNLPVEWVQRQHPQGQVIRLLPALHGCQVGRRLIAVPHALWATEPEPAAIVFHGIAEGGDLVSFQCSADLERIVYQVAETERVTLHRRDPALPARYRQAWHHAFHVQRARSIFGQVEAMRFGSVPKLWDFEAEASLRQRSTYYVYSGKGTGKTYQNIRLIGNCDTPGPTIDNGSRPATVLVVSPLISVAAFYAQPKIYDATNYDTLRDQPHELGEQTRLVCSIESLCKLPRWYHPDVVLLDESEWLLQLFSNPTTLRDRRQMCWIRFCDIITHARLVVCADAQLGHKTYRLVQALRSDAKPYVFYNYHAENANRYREHWSPVIWHEELRKAIEDPGKPKIFLPTNSKKQAHRLRDFIRQHDPEATILLITRDTYHAADGVVRAAVENCNEEWPKYRYVIMTPVVGPAVDFWVEYFDRAFLWGSSGSCTPSQLFQMLGRVRKLRGLRVDYYIQQYTDKKRQQAWALTEEQARERILSSATETTTLGVQMQPNAQRWNHLAQRYEHVAYDADFLDLHAANVAEEERGHADFAGVLRTLILDQQGQPPLVDRRVPTDDAKEAYYAALQAQKQRESDAAWAAFQEARVLTEVEARQLEQQRKHGVPLDTEQQAALEKFHFLAFYALPPEQVSCKLFAKDSEKRRDRYRAYARLLNQPQLEQLLDRDHEALTQTVRLRDMAQLSIADVQLQSCEREAHLQVLRVFGFPSDATLAACLHTYNTIHLLSAAYCEHTLVVQQLRLLLGDAYQEPKRGGPLAWLRKYLQRAWQVTLGGTRGFHIDPGEPLGVLERRHPDHVIRPPNAPFIETCVPFATAPDPATLAAFCLCFSPRHLPSLARFVDRLAVPPGPQRQTLPLLALERRKDVFLETPHVSVLSQRRHRHFWTLHWEGNSTNILVIRQYASLREVPIDGATLGQATEEASVLCWAQGGAPVSEHEWAADFLQSLKSTPI